MNTGGDFDRFFGDYDQWNEARLTVLAEQLPPAWWQGKRVIVAGSGDGRIACRLVEWGAVVTAADGREEYALEARKRCPGIAEAIAHDFDGEWTCGTFDVCVHFGLLYHLAHPAKAITDVLRHCSVLCLESSIIDLDTTEVRPVSRSGFDQALNGRGSLFGAPVIETTLAEAGWSYRRIRDVRLHVRGYTYLDGLASGEWRGLWIARGEPNASDLE